MTLRELSDLNASLITGEGERKKGRAKCPGPLCKALRESLGESSLEEPHASQEWSRLSKPTTVSHWVGVACEAGVSSV